MSLVPKIALHQDGQPFSTLVQGYWRMASWQRTPQAHLSFLKSHIELGITTVDHAHVYGSPACEVLFGNTLKLQPSVRQSIEIITKCGIVPPQNSHQVAHYDSSSTHILNSVETSLIRLGVEHIDLLLIHRPDWLMNAEEVADTFEQLQRSGKVANFGVSNFSSSQFALLQSACRQPLITNQIEINPFDLTPLENGTLEALQQQKIRPMAWSCLAGGKLFSDDSPQIQRLRKTLKQIAEEVETPHIESVVYAWVLKLPVNPLPIIGSGNIERVQRAISGLNIALTHEQWYRIWVASTGHGVA
jgi:predicted oxidoreductase